MTGKKILATLIAALPDKNKTPQFNKAVAASEDINEAALKRDIPASRPIIFQKKKPNGPLEF